MGETMVDLKADKDVQGVMGVVEGFEGACDMNAILNIIYERYTRSLKIP